ncbi:DUF5666 domain-containing protein [Aestuariibius sp. 2305UL40-4]|uniref:DUF5666 domain-containing protein n=1 Tax=Aestuariibius violaceus TaxID=3234132 RepID=UPI00345EE96E
MRRRHFLATCTGAALAAPYVAAQDSQRPSEGGIGGTGIVGLLTDFSSLVVGGLRVETDRGTRFVNAYGRAREGDIGIGTALTVEAIGRGGVPVARRVEISYPLVGEVAADGTVNGIRITAEPGALGRLAPGDTVAISGVWRNDGVVASRFDPIRGITRAVIAGEILPTESGWRIGTTPVLLPQSARPIPGGYETLLGQPTPEGFQVDQRRIGRFDRRAQLDQLAIEGFLRQVPAAPGYRIAGLGHSFDDGAQLAPFAGERTLFTGPYGPEFNVANGLILPQALATRRRVMADAVSGGANFRPAR